MAICFAAIFVLLALLVPTGMLSSLDLWAASLEDPGLSPALDALFPAVSTLWSPEFSVAFGLAGLLPLWRLGLRFWSAAPLTFLLLVPLEVLFKATFHRPELPALLKSWPAYPLVNPVLGNSVLNGSAVRSAFLCVFAALVISAGGSRQARPVAAAFVALTLLTGVLRVYGRWHWLTNEVASQALGAAVVLIVAVPMVRRLEKQG